MMMYCMRGAGEIDLNMFAAGKGGVSNERTKKIEEIVINILVSF
jgi:hypothetical protein